MEHPVRGPGASPKTPARVEAKPPPHQQHRSLTRRDSSSARDHLISISAKGIKETNQGDNETSSSCCAVWPSLSLSRISLKPRRAHSSQTWFVCNPTPARPPARPCTCSPYTSLLLSTSLTLGLSWIHGGSGREGKGITSSSYHSLINISSAMKSLLVPVLGQPASLETVEIFSKRTSRTK